jgi:hypothetical protein
VKYVSRRDSETLVEDLRWCEKRRMTHFIRDVVRDLRVTEDRSRCSKERVGLDEGRNP